MPRLILVFAVLVALLASASAHAAEVGINVPGGAAAGQHAAGAAATGAKSARVFWFYPGGSTPGAELGYYRSVVASFAAHGMRPVITLTGHSANGLDVAAYASYVDRAASALGSSVAAWEIWNEPDEAEYWGRAGGDPVTYTALLKALYPRVSRHSTVLVGGLVGNDYEFVERLYAAGAKGSFDGIATHTDTACSLVGPDSFYRDANGRINRYSFLGFREVHATMARNGDGHKPIWITELGWNTMPGSCDSGAYAGKKDAGVSQADQAKFLAQAWNCLSQYPYVTNALWFNLQDSGGGGSANFYGLLTASGARKQAYATFVDVARGHNPYAGQKCGDFEPPTLTVKIPANAQFSGALPLRATATDPSGVGRVSYYVDDATKAIRNFTPADRTNFPQSLDANLEQNGGWQGAKALAPGRHTIRVVALDKHGNTSTASVTVFKVDPSKITASSTVVRAQVSGRGTKRTVKVFVSGTGLNTLKGKVRVIFEKKVGGRWKAAHKYDRSVKGGVTITKSLKKAIWRVRVLYLGSPGYKPSSATPIGFVV